MTDFGVCGDGSAITYMLSSFYPIFNVVATQAGFMCSYNFSNPSSSTEGQRGK
jgi:hypothetical protein